MSEPIANLSTLGPDSSTRHAHPRGFTVTAGEPRCTTWPHFERDDGDVLVASGLLECTAGVFRFRSEHWEFFHLLEGRVRITLADEPPRTLEVGDAMVIEAGTAGTWEVMETMRKHFVTRLTPP